MHAPADRGSPQQDRTTSLAAVARKTKQARLTPESYEAWERLLTRRGVTFTALVEALGEALATDEEWVPETAIRRAREIDRARYSRR